AAVREALLRDFNTPPLRKSLMTGSSRG
ncbi:hypothetical protein ACFGTY_004340, partial [Shigella flexneri]